MDASTNPNHSPSPKSNIYHISGVPVEFPYKPYGTQLAYMSRVISTLDRANRQGRCHALLESPTGTGKTLSLLCSSLAWQKHQSQRHLSHPNSSVLTPPESTDPFLHGGGFIVEPDASGNPYNPPQAAKVNTQKKRTTPNIYYASRTHSQISQVIREYKRTAYRVPMAVLASRKHYCTNKHVCGNENVDAVCKLLLKDPTGGCPEFKNANKVKGHPSIQIGGCLEVHDIEDLVRIGQHVKGCSYFAAQTLAAEAQLIFCPYSYIINPIVRRSMDVDIKGCILIIDEAHNIEDMARESGSVDIEEEVLHELQAELGQLCLIDNLVSTYRPLYDIVQGIISWINARKDNLLKSDFEHYLSYWTGEKAKQELQQSGISQQYFPILQECAIKAIKSAYDAAPGETHLTGISLITLESLFSSLSYFFSQNGCYANDYQLALQRFVKRDGSNAPDGWTTSLSLWCLNPAVVFKDIADLSLSVILTSGTLSPMGSFSSELGVRFDTCMEAPHVINTESQLLAAVISSGAGNIQLNASYKTSDSYTFQDSLGETLEEICKIVPGGALVFFPSYKLLEKLHARWLQTGQWSKLNVQKEIFIEQRGNTNEFEQVLRSYYDTISRKNKPVSRKIRSGLKLIQKRSSSKVSSQNPNKGAAFLAVCRGKVSEGIDFSDDNARVVVIVGIPFPNKNDAQVMLKKKFNDTYKSSKNLLSGSEWYCHQAFRALNQAAGRCIRHRFDYGAIILLDERYKEQRNLAYISKWLRSSIKSYNSFDESLEGLQTFFRDAKQRQILEEGSDEVIDYNNNKESLKPLKSSFQVTASKRNTKLKEFNNHIGKIDQDKKPLVKINQFMKISTGLVNESFPVFQPQTPVIKSKEEEDEKLSKNCNNVGYENKSLKHFSAQTFSSESSPDLVKDTCDSSEVEYLPVFHHSVSKLPSSLSCITTSSVFASHDACLKAVTPDKLACSVPSDAEHYPHFDSVNSYNHKKRRLKELQSTSFPEIDCSNSCFSETTARLDLTNSTNIPQIINSRTELSFDDNKKAELGLSKPPNKYIPPPFSNFYEEMELHVCCLSCKKPWGLPENSFLIKSFMMLSSKVHLSYIRKYGTQGVYIPDCNLKTQRMSMHVLTFDITLINETIFKERAKKNFTHDGIWCEEDGCVFRAIFCPFCTAFDACIGVHVLATDASNTNLLNKVLLFADRVCVSNESKAFNEGVLTKCGNLLDVGSDQVENQKYTCSVLLKKPVYDSKRKPTALMKNTHFPNPCLVTNAKCVGKVVTNKPGYPPKMKLNSAKEHVDNFCPRPVDIEKFAYKPQGKLINLESLPSNVHIAPEQIAKSAFCSHPNTSNSITTTESRLKLPIRRQKTAKKLRNTLAAAGVPDI